MVQYVNRMSQGAGSHPNSEELSPTSKKKAAAIVELNKLYKLRDQSDKRIDDIKMKLEQALNEKKELERQLSNIYSDPDR